MKDCNFFEIVERRGEQELQTLMEANDRSSRFGLCLSEEEARTLAKRRNESLREQKRIEFGEGILDKLIDVFCDSDYVIQEHYLEILSELQDIFYLFKNESADQVTDDELLVFMKEQFETVCMGDTEYLRDTCLSRFAKAVRSGYTGYQKSQGSNEYEKFSEEQRWDASLYREVLKDLCWK